MKEYIFYESLLLLLKHADKLLAELRDRETKYVVVASFKPLNQGACLGLSPVASSFAKRLTAFYVGTNRLFTDSLPKVYCRPLDEVLYLIRHLGLFVEECNPNRGVDLVGPGFTVFLDHRKSFCLISWLLDHLLIVVRDD